MQKREIEKVGTPELLYEIVQLAKGSWAFAGLAGFCLTFLAIKEDAIEFLDQILLVALIVGCVAFLVYQHWWTTKKAIPELQKRCSDLPVPESSTDSTGPFRAHQRLSKFGLYIFLISIPAFIVAYLLGYNPFNKHGAPTAAGWLIIIGILAPGLYLALKGAQCPSCKKLIHGSYGNTARCPHCGARIRDDV